MKLYYAPGTCALTPHIALEWTGQPYEIERAELDSDDYLKINPLGAVPALKDGDLRIMAQADAILKYIATRYPEADLGVEKEPVAQFELNEALAFLTGDFHPAFFPFFAPARYTTDTNDAAQTAVRNAAHLRIDRVMAHLDTMLDGRLHVVRNKRTVADPYAFAMARWTANAEKTWHDYPAVKVFMEAMLADTGVKTAMKAQELS